MLSSFVTQYRYFTIAKYLKKYRNMFFGAVSSAGRALPF